MSKNDYNNFNDNHDLNRRSGQVHYSNHQKKVRALAKSKNHRFTSTPETDEYKEPHHPVEWTIMLVLLIAAIIALAFGYRAYQQAQNTFSGTYQKDGKKDRNVASILAQRKPFSVLLMGTDTGALGRKDVGRTDTIILATVNPEKQTTYLTSIPRDTKVVVPGDSQPYEKINAAYTVGGPKTAIKTVSNLLNVPIDFFAIVNMRGLEKMVDSVGGVEVKPPLTFQYKAANVQKGKTVKLDGKQALAYSRMRDDDPLGDYGRQKRQRQVLEKVVMDALNIGSATRYQQILQSLNGTLKTDMTFDDLMAVRSKYTPATHHIKTETLQGQDAMIDNISYQIAPQNELIKVMNNIRGTLGLPLKKNLTPIQQQTDSTSDAGGSTDNVQNNAPATGTGATQGTGQGAAPTTTQSYGTASNYSQY